MGEWKIILGSYNKELKGFKGNEGRVATLYQILTRDSRTFILYDYEVVNYDDIREDDKGNKTMSGILEINGVYYKRYGTEEKYPSTFNDAVNCYITNWVMSNPNYDITDIKTAIKLFGELNELKSELLMLKLSDL